MVSARLNQSPIVSSCFGVMLFPMRWCQLFEIDMPLQFSIQFDYDSPFQLDESCSPFGNMECSCKPLWIECHHSQEPTITSEIRLAVWEEEETFVISSSSNASEQAAKENHCSTDGLFTEKPPFLGECLPYLFANLIVLSVYWFLGRVLDEGKMREVY